MGCFKLEHIEDGYREKFTFSPKSTVENKGNTRIFRLNTYPYGFNGMEADDDIKGEGNSYTTEFRQLDPRIGRWLSTDPIVHPHQSPYSGFNNNPLRYADPRGAKGEDWIKKNGSDQWEWDPNVKGPGEGYEYGGTDHKYWSVEGPIQLGDNGSWNHIKSNYEVTATGKARSLPNPYQQSNGLNTSLTGRSNNTGPSFGELANWTDQAVRSVMNSFDENVIEPFNDLSLRAYNYVKNNPDILRQLNPLPDAVSLDFDASTYVGPGTSGTLHFNWILKGPNASFRPVVSYEQTVGGGWDVSASVGLSQYRKVFSPMQRTDFATNFNPSVPSARDVSYQASLSASFLAKLGVNGGFTLVNGGTDIIMNGGVNYGFSAIPTLVNGSGGVSNSWILFGEK